MVGNKALNRLSVTIKGGRGGALEVAWGRVFIMKTIFLGLYCVIGLRLFDLMLLQTVSFSDLSPTIELSKPLEVSAEDKRYKGDIVDRNGVLLATSLKTASLYADPKNIISPAETAKALSTVFPDLGYDVLLRKLQRSGRFVWLKRGVVPDDQMTVTSLSQSSRP